jgi:hypothetical protein
MATLEVHAERRVDAPAPTVYGYLADMQNHHPRILPAAFTDFGVESGGVGAGTVVHYTLNAGGRTRRYRMQVGEPDPGRVLTESDLESSLVTSFTVTPEPDSCRVEIKTTWQGAAGIGGFFERMFAPKVMQRIYSEELDRLAAYAASGGAVG